MTPLRTGPPRMGTPWFYPLPFAFTSGAPQPVPAPPANQTFIQLPMPAVPHMPGSPYAHPAPPQEQPSAKFVYPGNPGGTPVKAGAIPFLPRVPKELDERRLARLTERLHSAFNALVGSGQLVQTGSASWKLNVSVPPSGLQDPTAALGDLIVRGPLGTTRIGVGANGQVLTADSTQPNGLAWETPSGLQDPTTTIGDLIVRGPLGTTRIGVGANGQVLTADSTQPNGLAWETPSGGGGGASRGPYASRPSAVGNKGLVYLATDGPIASESDGTTWKTFGPLFPLTDPTTPSWAWQNQGTATVSTAGGVESLTAPSQNGDAIRARVIALAAPPYTYTALLSWLTPGAGGNGMEAGLCLSDGTGYVVFFSNGARTGVRKYASATAFSSNYAFDGNVASSGQLWLRIADNGGAATSAPVSFQLSPDGVNWSTYVTRNRNDFLTESKVGFYSNFNNTGGLNGMNGIVSLYSWSGP